MLLVLLRVVSVRVMRVDHVLSQVWLRPELRCGSCEVPYYTEIAPRAGRAGKGRQGRHSGVSFSPSIN